MEYERAIMDPRFNELEFTATDFSSNRPKSKNKTLKDKVGNPAWRTDLYFPQTIILSLEKMSNVTYFYLESFDKGCNLDISIAEHETGPYVQVVHKKFFARSELRRIKLGSLPCKFLKVVVHKGTYISPEQIHLVGFHAEDAGEIFGDNLFELLVANSQRLIYS